MINKLRKKASSLTWKICKGLKPSIEQKLYKESIQRFRKKMMDPEFEWEKYAKDINPYFKQFGYKFSSLECEYYAACTGVKSDLFLPIALYEKLIYPYLNPAQWRVAYCDKNMFPRLFNIKEAQEHIDIRIPEYVTYCDNGRYYLPEDRLCTREESIESILQLKEDVIIKPTIDSWHGRGVVKVSANELTREHIEELYKKYGNNFTVQKVIIQHPYLAAFNPTSVNTIRITTYQDFNGNVKVLYASQRFGGKGKVYDNADDPKGSGGFCPIQPDGTVKREIHRYRNLKTTPLDESVPGIIPCYDKVVAAVKFLHTRFPQFGIIGWDMTVTPDGHPLVIEYNFAPGLGTGQLAHGPMFSKEDLDEIMERVIKNGKQKYVSKLEVSYSDRSQNTVYF